MGFIHFSCVRRCSEFQSKIFYAHLYYVHYIYTYNLCLYIAKNVRDRWYLLGIGSVRVRDIRIASFFHGGMCNRIYDNLYTSISVSWVSIIYLLFTSKKCKHYSSTLYTGILHFGCTSIHTMFFFFFSRKQPIDTYWDFIVHWHNILVLQRVEKG